MADRAAMRLRRRRRFLMVTSAAASALLLLLWLLCCANLCSVAESFSPSASSSCHRALLAQRIDPKQTTTTTTTTTVLPMLLGSPSSSERDNETKEKTSYSYFDPLNLRQYDDDDDAGVINNGVVLKAFARAAADENEILMDKKELGIWAARGILLIVAAIWGTNFASVKYLETLCFHPPCNHPPSEAAFARFGVAAVVGLPLLLRQRWDVIRAGFECGLFIFVGYATQAMALATIDAGKCAFICSLTVVFVPLVSAILHGKEIKATNIAAAFVALLGVGVLEGLVDLNQILLGVEPTVTDTTRVAIMAASGGGSSSAILETASSISSVNGGGGALAEAPTGPLAALAQTLGVSKGDILALGQPIGFGNCFTRIEHYQEEFKDVPDRILTIAAAQCVAVGILAFIWVLYDYQWTIPNFGYMLEPHRLAAIGWTGIVTTVFAIFLEGIALQTATATDAALIFSTEPLWAGLFGFVLLSETLGRNDYIGGAIILVACLIGSVSDLLAEQFNAMDSNYYEER